MLAARSRRPGKEPMSTYEQIVARELKPGLLELDGISRETVEAHYKLYQGYVNKRNEILGQARRGRSLDREPGVLRPAVAEGRSDLRDRRDQEPRDLLRAPRRARRRPRRRRSATWSTATSARSDAWRADLKATGMGGRGWAWTAYDWDEGRLFNYIGDAQNTFPIWNATPLVALDVYEHAYFLDFQTDRASYIEAFFNNLDWSVVNDWVAEVRHPRCADARAPDRGRLPGRQHPDGILARPRAQGRRHPDDRQRHDRRRRTRPGRSRRPPGWRCWSR